MRLARRNGVVGINSENRSTAQGYDLAAVLLDVLDDQWPNAIHLVQQDLCMHGVCADGVHAHFARCRDGDAQESDALVSVEQFVGAKTSDGIRARPECVVASDHPPPDSAE